MNFWKSLAGRVRVELTCADPGGALAAVNLAGITVYEATRGDDDIVSVFFVHRGDVRMLRTLAKRKGWDLRITGRVGVYWTVRSLLARPVLLLGMLFLCACVLYLPTRVYFIHIEGNDTVPTRLILEKCGQIGIRFGASRREVRSEKVKNALLEAIPELQWAGINTNGCVATVTVRERSDHNEERVTGGVSSIIASCDGVITDCTVTQGNQVCRIGQAVRAGELLVSGFTDCGLSIRATRAEAEIYAQTQRSLTAVLPQNWTQTADVCVQEKKYALIIGKKRINLYKDSGISGTTCDKIYSEVYITLPGGFQLPIAIVTEVWSTAGETVVMLTDEAALVDFASRYLSDQMTAGTILSRSETLTESGDILCLQGNYACTEMIAQVRNEEIIKPYGNDN